MNFLQKSENYFFWYSLLFLLSLFGNCWHSLFKTITPLDELLVSFLHQTSLHAFVCSSLSICCSWSWTLMTVFSLLSALFCASFSCCCRSNTFSLWSWDNLFSKDSCFPRAVVYFTHQFDTCVQFSPAFDTLMGFGLSGHVLTSKSFPLRSPLTCCRLDFLAYWVYFPL